MAFYDLFLELCEKKGIRPSHVAQACGFNRSNITNWKNGGYTPRGVTLQRIADFFGVPVGYLLGTVNNLEDGISFNNGTGFGGGDAVGCGFGDGSGYGGPLFPQRVDSKKKVPAPEGEREIDDRRMKAAFLGGLADGLSDEEIDEYWDDARDYIGYKIQQKKNRTD